MYHILLKGSQELLRMKRASYNIMLIFTDKRSLAHTFRAGWTSLTIAALPYTKLTSKIGLNRLRHPRSNL
jgi:hypothetical protein